MNTTQVINTAALVKKEVGKIDILINNAGIVVGKYFIDHTHEDIDKTMGINSNALMHITREFLGDMMQTKQGHIVNIASACGQMGAYRLTDYCSTKFAVVGFTESLRMELKINYPDLNVITTTVFIYFS
jgi:short-subunit dehydrogenase